MTLLVTGQIIRFKGRTGPDRAREAARELNGCCVRNGHELEITSPVDVEFKASNRGFHLSPVAEHKIDSVHHRQFAYRRVDFR